MSERSAGAAASEVRLSQCMIVKNEEKNIERALSWAKRIAFEQIVVDTGSTDRTVEIAESMGAKVYHFEWVSDFAAAKNYAIEQASGDWIAFLDADEHMSAIDAKKLMVYLKNIESDPIMSRTCLAINCKWAQIGDNGKVFAIYDQERIFRNIPSIRYVGKIHEMLTMDNSNVARADEITIIHTGYSSTANIEGNKAERNINILREELKEKPDDVNLMTYLADALRIAGDEESNAEAEGLYRAAIESGKMMYASLLKSSYLYFVEKTFHSDNYDDCEQYCHKALLLMPEDVDFEYFLAAALSRKGDNEGAWKLFSRIEDKMISSVAMNDSRIVSTRPEELFHWMMTTAAKLNDAPGVIRYATMLLTANKANKEILAPYIEILLSNAVPEDEILRLLAQLYDMDEPKDLLLIARAARDCGAFDLAQRILRLIAT